MAPALLALGDDFSDLDAILTPLDHQVMEANGYPASPLAITPRA
jgi:hypothetical protein